MIKFVPGVKPDDFSVPRLYAESYYKAGTVVSVQHADWSDFVAPMYLNDQLGDCTCAGICHCWGSWTKYAANGAECIFTDPEVQTLYERFGYIPGQPNTDQGAMLAQVLQSVHQEPVEGHTIDAWAQVTDLSVAGLTTALKEFGPLYLGGNCTQSMEDQFNAGKPFSYVPGSQNLGGHCVLMTGFVPGMNSVRIATWGQPGHPADINWLFNSFLTNGGQAFAIYSKDFINARTGKSASNIDQAALLADMQAISSFRG